MMEFFREARHTARKARTCEACRKEICPGESYLVQTGKWEGDFFTRAWCEDCELVMSYYFDFCATEEEFEYWCVEDSLTARVCCYCIHGAGKEDDCKCTVWHCGKIQDLIKEAYDERRRRAVVRR